jgi:hypothetical protein
LSLIPIEELVKGLVVVRVEREFEWVCAIFVFIET